jgi:hypothetical protein
LQYGKYTADAQHHNDRSINLSKSNDGTTEISKSHMKPRLNYPFEFENNDIMYRVTIQKCGISANDADQKQTGNKKVINKKLLTQMRIEYKKND